MGCFDNFVTKKLSEVKKRDRYRQLSDSSREEGIYIYRDGRKYISFSCNDYLGLTANEDVRQAAISAIKKYGVGGAASRMVTGNHPLYGQLERELADYKATESALVFGSGYLANIGIISALVGNKDLVVADRLVHACIIDGIKLSGAKMMRFKHNDVDDCRRILDKYGSSYEKRLIITDHVFSMDGDVAPLEGLKSIAIEYDALLISDDAHFLGGYFDGVRADIQMGTLSKAFGSYGGYVCANEQMIDYLRNFSRSLIFSTALPPAVVAASLQALKIIKKQPELVDKALENSRLFASIVGLGVPQSPIVPLIIGDDKKSLEYSSFLEKYGYIVSAIRPPAVSENTARLRFTFSALHAREDIEDLAFLVKERIIESG